MLSSCRLNLYAASAYFFVRIRSGFRTDDSLALAVMAQLPTFFFSHARQDRETPGNYLRTFFEDLERKLAQWSAVDLTKRRLGTFDSRVKHGEDWDERLSHGLAQDTAFVAILSPLYFTRVNCGKELFVFLVRHSTLGVNQDDALTGAQNVLPIRWLPEKAYTLNTVKDALIPGFIRLISDTPADDGYDPERTKAIDRYRKKGMEKCVKVEPEYGELLDLLVARIRELPELVPSGSAVRFATAKNAFEYDWKVHFTPAGAPSAPSASPAALAVAAPFVPPVAPLPLSSIISFYVTRRRFTPDAAVVDFADQLIAEIPGTAAPADPVLLSLLADVRAAALAEGLNVFHAAGIPAVPASLTSLVQYLASLTESKILTALVIDPDVWPRGTAGPDTIAIEQIIKSTEWVGPVLIPRFDGPVVNIEQLVVSRELPARLVALPQDSSARVVALQQAFVEARGRVLRATTGPAADAVPILKGVGART